MLKTRFIGLTNICKSTSTRWQQKIITTRTYIRPHYYNNNEPLSKVIQAQKNPLQIFSRKLNSIDPNKVLWSVIGTNVGVFLMWQYAINSYKQFGDSNWLNVMGKHFISSPEAISNGRYHTLLTSAFSHKSLEHIGLNMLVLYSIGQGVIEAIGASRFLLLYAGAGITASVVGIGYKKYIRPMLEKEKYGRSRDSGFRGGSMGASGSVMAITSFFACAYPRATFLVFFVIPMPAIAVVGLFAAYDIYKASTLESGIVDSAAHIGGVAYGAGYWFLRVRPMLKAGRWRV